MHCHEIPVTLVAACSMVMRLLMLATVSLLSACVHRCRIVCLVCIILSCYKSVLLLLMLATVSLSSACVHLCRIACLVCIILSSDKSVLLCCTTQFVCTVCTAASQLYPVRRANNSFEIRSSSFVTAALVLATASFVQERDYNELLQV